MTDYANLKVPDLKKLLQERSLTVSGNKAELVARLQENDSSGGAEKDNAGAAATIAPPAEDEIDWDDEEVAVGGDGKATSDPAAAAMAAGGQGQAANPTTVPNQKIDTDPSKTSDLSASKPLVERDDSITPTGDAPSVPAIDFTSGVAATSLDDEIKKRQARAKRFNVEESESDAIKSLERAKRFGTGTGTEQAAGDAVSGNTVSGLDRALPERRERKRGRDDFDGRGGKRRRGGRGGQGFGGGGSLPPSSTSRPAQRGSILDDPSERAKAEARAKKFAAPAA